MKSIADKKDILKESIIKFAGLGKSARIDEGTVIIGKEEKPKIEAVGVEIEEMRDFNWMKNLTGKKSDEHVFGNEYIKKRYI